MPLTKQQTEIAKRAARHGIRSAPLAYEVWHNRTPKPPGYDFALICALLMQETAGGMNVFGHDPTIFVGAGTVTQAKYLAYRRLRDATGKMQGVGAMQLTWRGYQDEADKAGGCWTPRANMHVGFVIVRDAIERYGLFAGVAAYNGTGPAARRYATSVLTTRQAFEHYLSGARLDHELLAAVEPFEPSMDDQGAFDRWERDFSAARQSEPELLPH